MLAEPKRPLVILKDKLTFHPVRTHMVEMFYADRLTGPKMDQQIIAHSLIPGNLRRANGQLDHACGIEDDVVPNNRLGRSARLVDNCRRHRPLL